MSSWLLVQVADLVLENIAAPDWVMQTIMLVLALGFPVVVFFSWAYEVTPEGMKRESEIDRAQSITHVTGRKLDRAITAVLVVALVYFGYDKFVLDPARDAELVQATTEQVVTDQEETSVSDKSIAVLPFVNMSDDASNEYFSEGLSEELLNLLVKIPELRVAARTSSFSFRENPDIQISEIARQLHVTHVLEGSVRKAGNQVRITAQLIKADDGFNLWSETYNQTLEDIFVVQDEIAAAVVDALKVSLLGDIPKTRETTPEVYSLYLKARYFDNFRGEENWAKAEAAYKQALAIDPEYAPAWAGLSVTYRYQANSRIRDFDAGMKLARETAEHVLTLDGELALAWANLGIIQSFYDWDWAAAERSFNKALRLEPGNAEVVNMAASTHTALGQLEKAIELLETSIKLDPLGTSQRNGLGIVYMGTNQLALAEESFRQLLELHPEYQWAQPNLARVLLLKGQPERALEEIGLNNGGSWLEFDRALILTSLGRVEEAEATVAAFFEEHGEGGYYKIAEYHAWRGDTDAAFESLELALDVPVKAMAFILVDPILARLKGDPRWKELLSRMGLPN